MSKLRVVISDFIRDDLAPEREILGDVAHVEALDAHHESELADRIEDAAAIMLYHNLSLTCQTIKRLRECKLIVRCGVGYNNVDCDSARQRGIPVANVPDYGTEEVADSAIGMALSLTRGIHLFNSRLRRGDGEWFYTQAQPLQRLRGEVFGIVGLGRIGIATALRAKALGMSVAFYDPYREDGYDKALGLRRVESLDELAQESYILSMHCPLTDQTRHMIDSRVIAMMRPCSYLVNTARGAVVDMRAVLDALSTGRLAGAGVDVLETEPPLETDPLLAAWREPTHPAHDRLILNPHAAFYCEAGLLEMRMKGAEACRRALSGQAVRNIVN